MSKIACTVGQFWGNTPGTDDGAKPIAPPLAFFILTERDEMK